MGQNPNPEEIDPEIRGIIKLLNSFPYIQTIGSCSGHYLWEYTPTIGDEEYPFVNYTALNTEAYTLTQKIIEELYERRRNIRFPSRDFPYLLFRPVAYLIGNDNIMLSATFNHHFLVTSKKECNPRKLKITDFSSNERREGVLRFLNDLESILKEHIPDKT